MRIPEKGTFGYINAHKKAQLIKTIVYFLLPAAIYVTGYLTTGGSRNYFTVIALVGSLPACKELVNVLMFTKRRSIPRELYEEIEAHAKGMEAAYELILTTYEKTFPLHSVVIAGNEVAGYTTQKDMDRKTVEEHITSVLKQNGLSVHVHIFQDLKQFMDRVDALSAREREEIPFQPDERYPDLNREQLICQLILAISM